MKVVVEILDPKASRLRSLVKKTATDLARFFNSNPKVKNGQVEIVLVPDRILKKNVWSYPAPANFPLIGKSKARPMGEIYINPGFIERDLENMVNLPGLQAQIKRENGLSFTAAFQYLLIHGFLHLLGYLHDKKRDRINMEKEEAKILSRVAQTQR